VRDGFRRLFERSLPLAWARLATRTSPAVKTAGYFRLLPTEQAARAPIAANCAKLQLFWKLFFQKFF
jgi:hypothetical protein